MSIDTRLSRLAPTLTARERAVLILRSVKARTPEDPYWRLSMPRDQAAEFSRLTGLINACNMYVPLYIAMVEQRTERLELRLLWWDTMVSSGLQVWKLAELIPASKRRQAEKVVSESYPDMELPWVAEESEDSWLTYSERLDQLIRVELVALWQEMRAIEDLMDEVALDFDGEDPLRPAFRGLLQKVREELAELHRVLSHVDPIELVEPDELARELARLYLDKGKN